MITKSMLWTTLSRIVCLLLTFACSVAIARFLGPEKQGGYIVIITLVASIVQFANLGMSSSVMYQLASNATLLSPLLANTVWISVVFGGFVGCVAVVACLVNGWLSEISPWCLWLAAAMVPSRLCFAIGGNLFVGLNNIQRFNLFQVLSNVLLLCAIFIVGGFNANVGGFLWANCVGWLIACLALVTVLARRARGIGWFDLQLFRDGFLYGGRAYLGCLLSFLLLRANVYLLYYLRGDQETGQYSIALLLIDALNVFPMSVGLVLFPALVKNQRHGWDMMLKSLKVVGCLMFGICCSCVGLMKPVVQMTFGPEYMPAVTIIYWMLPAVFFYGMTSIVSQYLAAKGFPVILVGIWGGALLVGSCLGYILIQGQGGVGAAAALSLVHAATFLAVLRLGYVLSTLDPTTNC